MEAELSTSGSGSGPPCSEKLSSTLALQELKLLG